jgi:hypothetical protein
MKNLILFFFLGSLLFSCLAEQDNPLLVESCMDKIKNQNEEGIDCGGICGGCVVVEPVIAPCKSDLRDNRITLEGIHTTLSADDYFFSQEAEYFEIFIMKNNIEITIQIYGTSLPTTNTAYDLDAWYDLDPGEASIQYLNFYSYVALTGKLYLIYSNQKWTIEICPVDLVGQGMDTEFSGRIICGD